MSTTAVILCVLFFGGLIVMLADLIFIHSNQFIIGVYGLLSAIGSAVFALGIFGDEAWG